MTTVTASGLVPTLSARDYCSADIFEIERERIFRIGWSYVCHIDGIAAGTRRVFELAGESVIVARDLDGGLHAFANVCRHRGAELCDAANVGAARGSIRCRYHGWTYGLDGGLLATPRVDDDFDRAEYGLWSHHADVWNGMVFVSMATNPQPLTGWLDAYSPALADFAHLPVADYRIGAHTRTVVDANWKILVENYAECLHCAIVHPELTTRIPLYRSGYVVDPHREDGAVELAPGTTALTDTGASTNAVLPGVGDPPEYDGVYVFPNVFFDLTPTNLALTALFPLAPDRTLVIGEYLFDAGSVARPDFDPAPEVDFNERIGAQDYAVCEMVQRGVSSPSFVGGRLTAKDRFVAEFDAHYLDARGALGTD